VAAAGGKPTKITTIDLDTGGGPDSGVLSLSPDGKQVAFTAATTQPVNSYTQPDLWILDLLPNAKPRNLTASFDFDVPGFVIADSAPPSGWRAEQADLDRGWKRRYRGLCEGRQSESGTVRRPCGPGR
jgi:Periplasmic component of the Tol biopolymer transport system